MCRGWLPLCHGGRLVRALRAIEAVGQTSAIPLALALPLPVAALPYVLALAPTAESLPAPKFFFCKNVFHTKATPFMGRTIFGQVFVRGGMSNFQNPKVPPTGGSSASQMTFKGPDLGLGAARPCSLLRPSQAHCSLA
jgi:hypothetical protein